jgi:membrane protein implicated in regulation of membrane protease activity
MVGTLPWLLQLDLVGPETLPLLLIIAGLGLSVAEAVAPGANFIVLGVALLGAGLLGLVLGPLATPLVLALLVFVFGGLALWGYREFDIYGGKGSGRTSDSDALKGKTGRVTERVTPTEGEVKLDEGGFNPYYAARSVDGEIAVGSEVIVLDPGGGNVLTVESFDVVEDEIDRELRRGRDRDAADEGSAESGDREAERDRETESERT